MILWDSPLYLFMTQFKWLWFTLPKPIYSDYRDKILCCYFLFILVPSAQPTNVELKEAQPSSLAFTWQRLPCSTRNGVVTYRYQLLHQSNVILSQQISDTFAFLSPLNASTDYEFRVAALTSAGMGPYSISIQARTSGELKTNNNKYIINIIIIVDIVIIIIIIIIIIRFRNRWLLFFSRHKRGVPKMEIPVN